MKNLFLTFGLTFLLVSCEKDDDMIPSTAVPQVVKSAFDTRYPSATTVSWKKDACEFEADFTVEGVRKSADFKSNGTFVKEDLEDDDDNNTKPATGTK